MSFKSRDLMIAVLPAGKLNALVPPGFALCGQATAGGKGGKGEEEDDDLKCGQATAGGGGKEPAYAPRTEIDLSLLRRQLREALISEARA